VLDVCPAAVTDEQGAYVLADFAPGVHEISVHVNVDCVVHESATWTGERTWSGRVRAGHAVRGRVVDPDGRPVGAAVVIGGGNWTPTDGDGTFWLDNVDPGPLRLDVVHHAWRTVVVPDVATDAEEVTIAFVTPLPRVTLTVVDAKEAAVPLVAIDWTWPEGGGPGLFTPDSRFWHDAGGVFSVVVPEGAVGGSVSAATHATHVLAPEDLADGARPRIVLADLPP
jgi:hypothetical protein